MYVYVCVYQGEEVMNTYGDLCNAALLHKYGFTERDNPYDEVSVTLILMITNVSIIK